MKIGIVGAGTVGQYLARALRPLGHEIMLSSRTPQSVRSLEIAAETGAQMGTVQETIAFGEVVALALSWDAVPEVVIQGDWAGKIVIDMMNRFGGDSPLAAAQELAKMIPAAHVVKALNTIGAELYLDPIFDDQAATMFIAGDDAQAKTVVGELLMQMRFAVVDSGDLAAAKHLENLAAFWVHLAMRTTQGRGIAFKLLKR